MGASQEKGICRLALVPVRLDPSHRSEVVTQLLFGDHYNVVDRTKDGQWLHVEIQFDQYRGWIQLQQHEIITQEYFEQIKQSDFHITLDDFSRIVIKNEYINILLGSIIPISTGELFDLDSDFSFEGSSKSLSEKWGFDELQRVALRFKNAPYLWGGKTLLGADCSGFVQLVFRICGHRLKRDASLQVIQGEEIGSLDAALPGDLAFFNNESGKTDHVGIILEGDNIIHASGKVRIDKIDGQGIFDIALDRYTHKFFKIRRILK